MCEHGSCGEVAIEGNTNFNMMNVEIMKEKWNNAFPSIDNAEF